MIPITEDFAGTPWQKLGLLYTVAVYNDLTNPGK